MRHAPTLVLSFAALAGAAGLWIGRPAGAADPVAPGAGRTAVVDIVTLLNASPRKKVIESQNLERERKIKEYADTEQQKIEDLRKDILARADNDPAMRGLETSYARAKVLLEFEMKAKVSDAKAAYSDSLESLYEEVRNAVREIAEQQGFALVLNLVKDRLDLRDSPGGFISNIAARPVIYGSDAVDITAAVKARLEGMRPPTPTAPSPVPAPVRPPAPLPAPAPGAGAIPPPSGPVAPGGMN
jgi:Skp family chaperone for outer membrane proteins